MTTYHFNNTYQWNYDNGPDFQAEFPLPDTTGSSWLLGRELNSRIGISAGILLNSKWVSTYARLGFDLLTYKTVRSAYRPCYPSPNWVFLDCPEMLNEGDSSPLIAKREPNNDLERLTSSVCFGMPSADPKVWREDIRKAKDSLSPGQILIVSVVGTPQENGSIHELAGDYALCAKWAAEAGADMIEANISCPNVCTAEGMIYNDLKATGIICEAIKNKIPTSIPLLLKIGTLQDPERYRQFIQATKTLSDGIVLVNCLSRRIHNPDGSPAFGPGKETAGVLGWATHEICLRHTRRILDARRQEGSPQIIFSVGGVVSVDLGMDYLDSGVDAVLLGGAPVFDPYLAVRIKERMSAAKTDDTAKSPFL